MTNILKMIKDAAGMQKNMKKLQSQLRAKTVEFSSGNGMVTVTARGDASIAAIRIDPKAMQAGPPAALEKLLLTAVEGALEAAKKMSANDMKGMMADMGLPNIPGLGI
ncbi:MAG: YbaB/EbfC family nucleoid-associated protein [Kiritimatiellae bacterium]|nr:YbaB/EbfC family nucleoid-associated protein [Kiritimatiellia bacterium]